MKELIGTCVENPFNRIEELVRITENGKEITAKTFRQHCSIHPDTLKDMRRFPSDYAYYKFQDIYYYEWSAIEYFYK